MNRYGILLMVLFIVGGLSFLTVQTVHTETNFFINDHSEIVRAFQDKSGSYEISVVGDTMFDWSIKDEMKSSGSAYPLEDITPVIEKSDYAILNLETAVGENGYREAKQYTFQSAPSSTTAMKDAGFDLVSLANNHAMDYGREGLYETINHLNNAGIDYVGAGLNQQEAYLPHSLTLQNQSVDILAFSHVLPSISWYADETGGIASGYQEERVFNQIVQSSRQSDTTIVYIHWGVERSPMPNKAIQNYAHRMIDAGADVVIGSHPHVLQGVEYYNNKPVVYSLGNFLFPDYVEGDSADSVIAQIEVFKDSYSLKLIPCIIKESKVTIADEFNALRISEKVIQRSMMISPSASFTFDDREGHYSLSISKAADEDM
ncbi:CapA family protein [Pseudalkalibacillus hwajinpoensis]|uniref:CapA family protein n=1 Tax=Guptibacillus hwajinpoensis TaxID=208199 RepID=UPI00325A7B6D